MQAKNIEQSLGNSAIARMRVAGTYTPGVVMPESRVDFRHASSHLSERGPGYYLIMLRHEIRHRSLRVKPALAA